MLYKELQPDNKVEINSINAINPDIITAIENNYSRSVKQVSNYAKQFRSDLGTHQTAYNVWCFLRKKIKYKKDGDTQKIKLPSRFLADSRIGSDCKSFSLFSAAVLGALNIPVSFRYTSYKEDDPTPSHVYITCQDEEGKEIIIDGCFNKFDEEKKYQYKIDHKMDVVTLSDDVSKVRLRDIKESDPALYNRLVAIIQEIKKYKPGNDTRRKLVAELKRLMNGIDYSTSINGKEERKERREARRERRQERREERKEGGGGKGRGAKRIALAPGRTAFLALVALNFRGLAKRLANAIKREPAKAKAKWEKLGGNFSKLEKAVNTGKDKKPLLGQSDKNKNLEGIFGEPITTGAVVLAALPVITSIVGFLKTIAGDKEAGGNIDLSDLPAGENADDYEVTDSEGGGMLGGNKTILIIGAAAVVGFLLLNKKK